MSKKPVDANDTAAAASVLHLKVSSLGVHKTTYPSGMGCDNLPFHCKAQVGRLRSRIAMSGGSIREQNDDSDPLTPTVYAITTTFARPVQGRGSESFCILVF